MCGAYDLVLHNYGAQRYVGSADVEIDEYLPLSEVSQRLNELQIEIYKFIGFIWFWAFMA